MFLRPFSEDPAARPASSLPVPRATRPRAGATTAQGESCAGAPIRRNVLFPAEAPRCAGFRRRFRIFRESLHEAAPVPVSRSLSESRGAPKGGRAGAALLRKARALRQMRACCRKSSFFSSDVSPGVGVLPEPAPVCAARAQKGVFPLAPRPAEFAGFPGLREAPRFPSRVCGV